jgi:putative ABC transport system permease protein
MRTLDSGSLRLTLPVLAFSFAIALASGIIFGLAPALRASRGDVNDVLKQGATGSSGRRGPGFHGVLLAAQIALAVVLLAGGILIARSFARLVNKPMGADTHHVLAFQVALPRYRYSNSEGRLFLDRLGATLRELPGVEEIVLSDDVPGLERDTVTDVKVVPPHPMSEFVGKHDVDADFFRLYRIPLRAGRFFTDRDRQGPKVAILSERAASALFPGRNPIGMHVDLGDDCEVVGVVGEVRYAKQKQQLPLLGDIFVTPASSRAVVSVRTAGDAASLTGAVRRLVTQLDPQLPAYNLRPIDDQIYEVNWEARFAAVLMGFFAALALGLALVGIYGVFSFAVVARTREFGIRIATGAGSADILWLVGREGALLCGAGLAMGLPAAFAATRLLRTMLYEVTPGDPSTYFAAALLLIATALGACFIPALRATRVSPMDALRHE